MYETLIYLVSAHAQVSNVVEPLLDRTLNALVEDLAEEALRCFRQVKRFGMGGMLRVSIRLCSWVQTVNHWGLGIGHTRNRIHAPNPIALRHSLRRKNPRRSI